MPIICIGPVCVPISAVWPVLILLIKPLWSWLETRYPHVNDYAWVQWFQKKFGSSPPELSKEIQDGVQAMSEKELSSRRGEAVSEVESLEQWQSMLVACQNTSPPTSVVAYFTATWCKPCQQIKPLYYQLSKLYPNSVFVKVDVDEAEDVQGHCQANVLPTFQVYGSGGKLMQSMVGAKDDELKQMLSSHLLPRPVAPNPASG